jgi:hypothetical protein
MPVFSWVFSISPANARIVSWIRTWLLPFISFPVHYSLIILSFNPIQSKLLKVLLNTCIPRYSALRLALFCYSSLSFFTEVQYYAVDSSCWTLAFMYSSLSALFFWNRLTIGCRLVVVMGWDCHFNTAALGLLYCPWMKANVTEWVNKID